MCKIVSESLPRNKNIMSSSISPCSPLLVRQSSSQSSNRYEFSRMHTSSFFSKTRNHDHRKEKWLRQTKQKYLGGEVAGRQNRTKGRSWQKSWILPHISLARKKERRAANKLNQVDYAWEEEGRTDRQTDEKLVDYCNWNRVLWHIKSNPPPSSLCSCHDGYLLLLLLILPLKISNRKTIANCLQTPPTHAVTAAASAKHQNTHLYFLHHHHDLLKTWNSKITHRYSLLEQQQQQLFLLLLLRRRRLFFLLLLLLLLFFFFFLWQLQQKTNGSIASACHLLHQTANFFWPKQQSKFLSNNRWLCIMAGYQVTGY